MTNLLESLVGLEGSPGSAGELPGADLKHFHWFCLVLEGFSWFVLRFALLVLGGARRCSVVVGGWRDGSRGPPPIGLLVKLRFLRKRRV